MKILIVDDTEVNLKTLTDCCEKQGFQVTTANNGEEAVEQFLETSPDLILMDVVMPVMNGFESTKKIKTLAGDRWIPIIIISALDDEADVIKGFESGADDYLSTPINLNVLRKKIRVMQRIYEMRHLIDANLEVLGSYRNKAEEELEVAKSVMEKIIGLGTIDPEVIQKWAIPAQHFSGDVIVATKTPSNHLYVCLADVAGHGLPAALIILPITQIFYTMAEKGCSLSSIAEELNWRINQQMPIGRFVAATFVSLDTHGKTIEIWNGGNIPPLLMNQHGEILHRWQSKHLPLGILRKDQFKAEVECYHWQENAQLFICSDGLIEAEGAENKPFGHERMIRVLSDQKPAHRFTALVDAVQKHLGSRPAHDDISLVSIECREDKSSRSPSKTKKIQHKKIALESETWKLSMSLGPEKIRSLAIVTLLLDWLNLMDIRKTQTGAIFVVLSELYTNALDHGLLKLDSKLKSEVNGFETYLSERKWRLENLSEGAIDIQLSQVKRNKKPMLRIRFKDSGPGFNYKALLKTKTQSSGIPSGRGIPLVKSLSHTFEYLGQGNEVVALFELEEPSPSTQAIKETS